MADAFTPSLLTPTPATDGSGDVGLLDDHRNVVAQCHAAIRTHDERELAEAFANARLFAAAQEMLRVLRALVDRDLAYANGFVDRGLIRIQDVQAARNAIAKATRSAS